LRTYRTKSRRNNEQGIIIVLVAVVMLGVVGAMAALSIDVVTIYTARSEAQLAADGAALAGARVLANSGMTSDTTGGLTGFAETMAIAVANQVAQQNEVGGRNLVASNGEVVVTFPNSGSPSFVTNPQVTVQVKRTDLPTFFARIWGSRQVTVGASATAEAYNPSGVNAIGKSPVAPICVKPWLLPNIDPSSPANPIFDTTTGAIAGTATGLLGWQSTGTPASRLSVACPAGDCSAGLPNPTYWKYYPGDPTTFPSPTAALPQCTPALTTGYQESIAGCVPTPISCNQTAVIDTSDDGTRDSETADAVNCLTHATAGQGDTVDAPFPPSAPFQFVVGDDNPVAVANPTLARKQVMTSDSLVTVPVFNSVNGTPPTNPVTIVGFVQLFLNDDGNATPNGGGNVGHVKTAVVNMAGCGSDATGQAIFGNGASPVAVRLISP
jgi:Putative Flp pilus-assembly TadE/G-like